MDKNTLTGIVLILAVFLLFNWLNRPSEQQQLADEISSTEHALADNNENPAPTLTDTISSVEKQALAATVKTIGTPSANGSYTLNNAAITATVDTLGHISGTITVDGEKVDINKMVSNDNAGIAPEKVAVRNAALREIINNAGAYKSFARFMDGSNDSFTLSNDLMEVTFATHGGLIEKVVLKKYNTETTTPPTPICLFDGESAAYDFMMQTADQRISTSALSFVPEISADSTSVLMKLPLADGASWGIRYTLLPGEYLVKMDIEQKGMDAILPASTSTMTMNWHQQMHRNEKGRTFEERNSAIYYKYVGDGPDDLNANKDDSKELAGRIKWVAFKNQFFSSVIIARQHFTSADLASLDIKSGNVLKDMSMQATMAYDLKSEKPASFDFYFGPNDYPLLSSLDDKISPDEDLDLTRLVPLGWGIFRWINQLIIIPVFSFLGLFISNYGIIILLLTIFIKLILFPFTYKSYISQAKMRVLAPEIKEINEKYPGQENAMKRQQETMALYSRAGASPFSGCLPMLLQMPVLIAMFSFFPSAIELRGQSFLWAKDLSAPDSILTLPFSIPFYGNHVSLFCLLMTVVNIIYTRINMQNQPGGEQMPGMKWMMYLMPVMFLFFFNDYASGLSYYYFLSLLITILQTYIFRHVIDEKKVRAQMLENSKKGGKKKKSGLMARLEAAQKRQEALMREQAKQRNRK